MMGPLEAIENIRWLESSGIQRELIDFAYLYVRSALNRILVKAPGYEIYSDVQILRQNLLGQASAVCMLDEIRKPNHQLRDWPKDKVCRVMTHTLLVYGSPLRFLAGMIDEQDAQTRGELAPFRETIERVARGDRVDLTKNPDPTQN